MPEHASQPQSIQWKHDAPASVVVFLVALRLCLGVALASGAPLFAGIIAGVGGGLVIAVVMMPRLLNRIPLAALAAILLHTGWKLAHPSILRAMVKLGRSQWIPYLATVVAILLTDLLVGIAIGMTIGIFIILRDTLLNPPFTDVSPRGAVLRRWQLHDHVHFLNKTALLNELDALEPGQPDRGRRPEDPAHRCGRAGGAASIRRHRDPPQHRRSTRVDPAPPARRRRALTPILRQGPP